ncbi:hypothetical protein IAR50_002340 [Cryptococcus sp. DSM 104548]
MPTKEEDIYNQELHLYLKHILQVWFEDSHEAEYLASDAVDGHDLEGWRFEVYPGGKKKEAGEPSKGVVINGDESPIALGIPNAGTIYATRIISAVSPTTSSPTHTACIRPTRPGMSSASSYASYGGGGGYHAASERASAMVERVERCGSGTSLYPSSLPMRS